MCDGIAEPCGWQLAKAAEPYFAGWDEDDKCGMCDADFAEFVTELGLERKQTCSVGCQAGFSALVSEAGVSANAGVRQRAVVRKLWLLNQVLPAPTRKSAPQPTSLDLLARWDISQHS